MPYENREVYRVTACLARLEWRIILPEDAGKDGEVQRKRRDPSAGSSVGSMTGASRTGLIFYIRNQVVLKRTGFDH